MILNVFQGKGSQYPVKIDQSALSCCCAAKSTGVAYYVVALSLTWQKFTLCLCDEFEASVFQKQPPRTRQLSSADISGEASEGLPVNRNS